MKKTRRSPRRRRLRNLVRLLDSWLQGQPCFFCGQDLWSPGWWKDGMNGVTIHHRNGDHDDERPRNKVWAHSACHKAHHQQQRQWARFGKPAGAIPVRGPSRAWLKVHGRAA